MQTEKTNLEVRDMPVLEDELKKLISPSMSLAAYEAICEWGSFEENPSNHLAISLISGVILSADYATRHKIVQLIQSL